MSSNFVLEVCVDSVESAVAAERGGAHRVELCSNLADGGVTPSAGLIAAARQAVSIGLHVMIRPRSADFCYSDDEFRVMQRDIQVARQLGADGIVFGILNLDGHVDTTRTKQLVDLAAPLKVTYHRAFDMCSDLFAALRDLQTVGVHRILTSGGEQTSIKGAETLKRLVLATDGSISIMAGGGIEDHNVADLIAQTGVCEIHASVKSPFPSPMRYQNDKVAMGVGKGREYQRFVVDSQRVQKLLRAAFNGAVKSS